MRSVFTLAALVLVLAIVGLLAKKQLAATRVPLVPGASSSAGAAPIPPGTPAQQSQQIQQQVQQQMDQLMQQRRPLPDDESK